MVTTGQSPEHIWQFAKVGERFSVTLNRIDDILNLENLDQKLWAALCCPVQHMEIDSRTMILIDTDNDGRIRVPELLAAVKWLTINLKNPATLLAPGNELDITNINTESEAGSALYRSATHILNSIGKSGSTAISVADTTDTIRIFSKTKFNGDGVITEESTDDPKLKSAIANIMECIGTVADRSGLAGIDTNTMDSFFKECANYDQWITDSEIGATSILPLGKNTEEAHNLLQLLKPKIDDYFIRCSLAAYDPRSVDGLNPLATTYQELSTRNLFAEFEEVEKLPISFIGAAKSLDLHKGINPAWKDKIERFSLIACRPLTGNASLLSESDWVALQKSMLPFSRWLSMKRGVKVEKIGITRVRELLLPEYRESISNLISNDLQYETEAKAIADVDKLVRYHRDLYELINNFVAFTNFYKPGRKAIFQNGVLYIDERECEFCVRVTDFPKHNSFASLSGFYLLYLECSSKTLNDRMFLVAAVTDGDVDNLMVGRNAIFYDRAGNDWNATVIKIIDNPISIRQAFWSPYRKFSRMIENQIKKIAAEKDKKIEESASGKVQEMSTKVENLDTAISSPTPAKDVAKPVPFDVAKFAGIFAAIGLAIGAIGTMLASVSAGFMSLSWWQMIFAIIGIIIMISGPSMLMAWLKLRKRNLAPILDANGWTINSNTFVNVQFGKTLTKIRKLPSNSHRSFKDPFAPKRPWYVWMIVFLLSAAVAVITLYKCRILQH